MKQISLNLPNERRYILVNPNTKKPLTDDWNNFDKSLTKEEPNTKLNDYNVGMLLGKGLIAIDCDSFELEQAVEQLIRKETYTQVSAKRGMKHFIFKARDFDDNLSLTLNEKPVGEILGKGRQIIIAPSEIEGKSYQIIKDIEPVELKKEELMKLILQFDSRLTRKTQLETKEFHQKADIDDLNITDILSTTGMKQDSRGQHYGSNPFHGSTTGSNFWINSSKNLGYCFRCDCAISPAKAIALNEGIISNCDDTLKGDDFIKVVGIAKEKYGLQEHTQLNEKTPEFLENVNCLNVMNIRDIENYKADKAWIIDKILRPKQSGLIYAPSTHLKSLYTLYMMVCVASGRRFLDKFKVKKQPVLFICAEDSTETLQNRLKLILKGLRIRKKDIPLYILPRSECEDIMTISFMCRLEKTIEEKSIKVCVFDTINPLTPEIDDNSGREVTKVFNKILKPLSDEYGVSPIFLHHTTKTEKQFLGSMKWKGNSENVWRLERKDLTGNLKIYNEKSKDGESGVLEINISFEKDKINFNFLSEGSPELFKTKKKMTQAEFFQLKLNELIPDKNTDNEKIMTIFKKNKIKFAPSTLYKVLKTWRGE